LPGPVPSAPTAIPGSPVPRPAPPPRPANLTPGAPIAPRPQGTRLVGQPAARPIVPPRPDVLARLQQQQARPPVPGAPRPSAPRPGSPAPGQPIFRGPIRPGQPQMRGGPGMPYPGQAPGNRRPGQRPMHPTASRAAAGDLVRGNRKKGFSANERQNGSRVTSRRRSIARLRFLKASRLRNSRKSLASKQTWLLKNWLKRRSSPPSIRRWT